MSKTPPRGFYAIESVVILIAAVILQMVSITFLQFALAVHKFEVNGTPATEEHRIYCGLFAAICFVCSLYVVSVKATEDERRKHG